jgi:hypothetical protein
MDEFGLLTELDSPINLQFLQAIVRHGRRDDLYSIDRSRVFCLLYFA